MNRIPHILLLGLTGLAATACTSPPLANDARHYYNVEEQYPITVEPQVATLAVQVDSGMHSLARGEDDRVATFAARWKARGQGLINVAAPTGPSSDARALAHLRKVLAANGVDSKAVQFTTYEPANGDQQAPISISFVAYTASAPECGGDWSTNLGYEPRNTPISSFGCATQHNMAAIVADPRDLVEPRPSEPSDAARRTDVLNKYQQGVLTRTQRDSSDNGASSDVKN